MKRFFVFALVAGLFTWVQGCSSGGPATSPEDAKKGAMESGLKAMQPGVDQDAAQQAMQQFYQTGEVSPELRKKLEQGGMQPYGGQYPGAGKRPPQ